MLHVLGCITEQDDIRLVAAILKVQPRANKQATGSLGKAVETS